MAPVKKIDYDWILNSTTQGVKGCEIEYPDAWRNRLGKESRFQKRSDKINDMVSE